MIHSMTAFARTQAQDDLGNFVCEMRSINHRYLEVNLHLPDVLRVFEMPIRERLRKTLKRGKVECMVRYQPNAQSLFSVNTIVAKELCHASETIASFLKKAAPVSPTDIMRFNGVLENKETDL